MESSILDFCSRYYEPQLSQSLYERRSLEEMRKLQSYIEFLDFGENGFQRNKAELPSGLKNIGNTCYFNVFVQLLYHINSIRDLFLQAQPSNDLVKSLKELFGRMLFSSLRYSDPTVVFNELKRGGMQVGQQYDFHQYLSITLDTLQKCLSAHKGSDGISQDRYINRIFFGKMNQYFNDGETLKRSVVKFGVITLDAKLAKLQEAFDAFRSYEIEGYKSQKGQAKVATVRSEVTEFPAILTFFVNRVDIQQGKLVKNNIQFSYPSELHLDTDTQIKSKISMEQQEIENKIKKVEQQLRNQQHKNMLKTLTKSLEFLTQQEEFEDLEAENNNNFGIFGTEESHRQTKDRLQFYINKLEKQDSFLEKRIQELKNQKKALSTKSTSFHYSLFALMIHEGTANSGHYYIIIRNESQDKWWKFSDRNVTLMHEDQVHALALGKKHKSTNACCIFYKQKEFVCDPTIKPAIPASLKCQVNQSDSQIIETIKYAKVNAMLRGCTEIAEEWINQLSKFSVDYVDYFSEEKYYCIASKSNQMAKFAAFKELINQSGFVRKLQEIDSIGNKESEFEMPTLRIQGISDIYYKSQNIIKTALWIQNQPNIGINKSLQLLASNRPAQKQIFKYYDRFLGIVLLKSCYRVDVKINKNESYEELVQLILNALELASATVVRTQVIENLKFSLESIGRKIPSMIKKPIAQPKIEGYKVPYVQIRSILNTKFKIWADFESTIQESGKTITQQKRTSLQSIEMVNDQY